jgi:hypothetical protein
VVLHREAPPLLENIEKIRYFRSFQDGEGANGPIDQISKDLAEFNVNKQLCLRAKHKLLCRVSANFEK